MTLRALLGTVAWILSAAGTGAAILAGLGPPPGCGRAMRLALALFLGFGALAWIWLALSLAGVPLDGRLLLAASAPGFFWAVRLAARRRPARTGARADRLETPEILLLAMLALGALLVVGQSLAAPLRSWDARTHWTMLARVLYYDGSVNAAAFHDRLRLLTHRSYPLLLPLTEWSFFHWIGSDDDRLVRLVSAAFYGVLLLAQYGLVRMVARRSIALLATALLCALPLLLADMDGGASSGYADIPLAAGVACYLACILSWIDRNRIEGSRASGHLLPALAGAFLVLIKHEGLAIIVAAVALLLATMPGRRRHALIHGGCILAVAAPWLLHAHGLPSDLDLGARLSFGYLVAGLGKSSRILLDYARDLLLRPDLWSLFWWLFLISAFTARVLSPIERFCLALLALILVIHFLVDVLVPWGPDVLDYTTRSRMWVQVAPAAILFIAMRLEAELSDPSAPP